jgi:hypothetical protein
MTTSSITARRSLHLVDLENLTGGPSCSGAHALAAFAAYLDAAGWQRCDHVIVASSHRLVQKFAFDLPVAANVHAASGCDGADLVLLASAPAELIVKRYSRLVIGSGDGIFAGRARIVRRAGVMVEVVARHGSCSKHLREFRPTLLALTAPDVTLAA